MTKFTYQAELEKNEKLDPTFKAEWVKNLLSGNYKQTKGALCKVRAKGEKAFCCLGLASEMYREKFNSEDNPVQWKVTNNFVDFHTPTTTDNQMPPRDVMAWAYGTVNPYSVSLPWFIYLDEKDAKRFITKENLLDECNYVALADLNDRGFPFKSIAYLVDKYL